MEALISDIEADMTPEGFRLFMRIVEKGTVSSKILEGFSVELDVALSSL